MWLRNRAGTEPVTARSPLRARRALSLAALVLGVVAAVFFAVQAMRTGQEVWRWEAAIAAAVAVIAAIDLVVLRRRRSGSSGRQHGQEQ
ncbi:unnamed protein product [[Actinomadura] parvosata subsp. kistnae]|uniref:Uncharacterized protein n=1 Tax=[Actinomadura] parvosata subsp. kistnae TaxID=1909395 RepID=A0A1V0A7Z9_9ACTN|nr:DUF6343 family protein [Nonomuraea sp. ATCC 55076]AQZ66313.1 hypothetical protein BKM31_36985 [Nonomuraea sp. ATCC 55076]SPL95672.1 unnamed protein product [Actinomadura parvosata subsp. kistnae]